MASVENGYNPWLLAKERYLEGLENHEKALFHEATLENLYDISSLERDDRSSKSRRITHKLQPLVEKIEDYSQAIEAYTKIAPSFISPIWGSVRVLLVIARTYGKFYERIVETLGRIGDILPRFRDYERTFDREKHRRLAQTISNAYLDIINLCSDFRSLLRDQNASLLKRIWKPVSLDAEFEEAIQRFREHRKAVEKEAETCHIIEAAEARALVEANKQLEEIERRAKVRTQLLAQLSSQDYRSRQRALRKLRHEETGTWMLTSPEYNEWKSNNCSAILSLYGIPGCGKSVLVSATYDALVKSLPESATVAYYCDYADKRTLDPINILGSIAHALLQKIEIPFSVQALIEKAYGAGTRLPQPYEIVGILKTLIETSFSSVTILVDGLDEMDEDERQFIHHSLQDILGVEKVIKLLISSRNDESQTIGLRDTIKYRIPLLPEKISNDISEYVRHTIQALQARRRLVLRNPVLEKEISKSLIAGAKGMFLWVKFQLEDLCTAETDIEIRMILQNLPKDLSETYDRLLGRVMGRQREQFIRRMFEWIICSKRPLHIDEVQEAIAFTINDTYWDESKIPNDMTRLVRACGNLVVIDEETTTLQFAHHTVEQYLLSRAVHLGSPLPFSRDQANIAAAEVCLAYLSFTDFEAQVPTYMDTNTANLSTVETLVTTNSMNTNQPFANTALRIWSSFRPKQGKSPSNGTVSYSQHVPKRKPQSEILLEKYKMLTYVIEFWLLHTAALNPSLDTNSHAYFLFDDLLNRKRLLFDIFPWSGQRARLHEKLLLEIAKIGWAVEYDHMLLLKYLDAFQVIQMIHEAVQFESELSSGDEPVVYIPKDYLDRLETFKGECPDSVTDVHCWLYAKCVNAARLGHLCVSYVNDSLPSPKVIGHLLLEAAMHGQVGLVKLLLPSSAVLVKMECLNEYPGLKLNALEVASFKGYPEIVGLLLENDNPPFHFNCAQHGVAALVQAVSQENTSVIEGLRIALFSKALPPSSREIISEAFISACSDGNLAVARVLFGKIDQLRPSYLSTALNAASEKGHHEILELFLPNGGSPISESDMRSAFEKIVKLPGLQSVKLFLGYIEENYTDPVVRARLLQFHLLAAASMGNLEVVNFLLDYSGIRMPNGLETNARDANEPDPKGTALCDASSLQDFTALTALKTLMKAAVSDSDFHYLKACIGAIENLPSFHSPGGIDWVDSLLVSTLNGPNPALTRRMVEMLLDLEPGTPSGDAQGDKLEASLLYIGGTCRRETVLKLLSAGRSRQEFDDKYFCMALDAALECCDYDSMRQILGYYDFGYSRYSRELKQRALGTLQLFKGFLS